MKFGLKLVLILALAAFAVGQVSVKSYTRSDGTVVSAYTRRSPSRTGGNTNLYNSDSGASRSIGASDKPPRSSKKSESRPANPCIYYEGQTVCGGRVVSQYAIPTGAVQRDSRGRIARSPEAKKSFEAQVPCPANGKSRGRCPGYVIDHIVPLACGGMDDPVNMQWQTVADGKAKDKWERKACGK